MYIIMDKCTKDKIENPKTNRCVKKDGKIGKGLLLTAKKQCLSDQIINPMTKRCVKRSGKIGQSLLNPTADNITFYRATKPVIIVHVNTQDLNIEQVYIGAHTKKTFFDTIQSLVKSLQDVIMIHQDQGLTFQDTGLLKHLEKISNNMATCKKINKTQKVRGSSSVFAEMSKHQHFQQVLHLVCCTAVVWTSDYDVEFKPSQGAYATLNQYLDKLSRQEMDMYLDGMLSKHYTLRQVLSLYGNQCVNTIGYALLEVALNTHIQTGAENHIPSQIHRVNNHTYVTMYTSDNKNYNVNVYDKKRGVLRCGHVTLKPPGLFLEHIDSHPQIKKLVLDPPASMLVTPQNIYRVLPRLATI